MKEIECNQNKEKYEKNSKSNDLAYLFRSGSSCDVKKDSLRKSLKSLESWT